MTGEDFVSRLQGVRRTGQHSWMARCPAHEDKSPSLTVSEKEPEKILAYCHAQCGIEAITGALGLEVADLFPPQLTEYRPRDRRPFPAADVLRALADEADILCVILHDSDWGKPLPKVDIERAQLAIERIRAARSLAIGE
jgi:hypothetical protein